MIMQQNSENINETSIQAIIAQPDEFKSDLLESSPRPTNKV
jgi:hypothetical protein